ncbi:MAG TPA: glycoside hydrolase family 1 protein [archaeon]|nr:glycoside hydrolase family 1 protein [archaeon]
MLSFKKFDRAAFPENFLWGAATSAYQVEGGNTKNQWYLFEQEPGRIERNEKCGRACGHYERFEEDFELAASLNHNAHRLGIEWSRICPEQGKFDSAEIGHYRRVFEALKKRGIKIFLTLHHFTEPVWFFKQGSFSRPGAEQDFAAYCERCALEYGDLVDFWITYNEPQVALMGWLWGVMPPGKRDLELACRVLAGQLKGHAAACSAIKGASAQGQVGIVMTTSEFQPHRVGDFLDQLFCELYDWLWTEGHLRALATGRISFPWIGEDEIVPHLAGSLDWLGLNYYCDLRANSRSQRKTTKVIPGERVTEMGWSWNPEGFYRAIERFARLGIPLYCTENGMATNDDYERVRFISEHLRVLGTALAEGFDIRGYLHWSLLDNFEWACGYRPRFGLVEVDYETLERKVRPSARFLAEIIEKSELSRELIERYLPEAYRF